MKFLLVISFYVIWIQFGNVLGVHDHVHHSTMRTVYEVQLDYIEIISNTETVFVNIDVRIKKFNRTTYILVGSFESLVDFDDNFMATTYFSAMQGNEYKVIVPPRDNDKFCTYLATEKMFYPEIQASSNFPEPGNCPSPAGKWELREYAAQNAQLPELPSSGEKWKCDLIISYKGKKVLHGAVYALVVAKRVRVDD